MFRFSFRTRDINLVMLKKKGIEDLIFDLDNTILSLWNNGLNLKIKDLIARAKTMGFRICLVSNSNDFPKMSLICHELAIDRLLIGRSGGEVALLSSPAFFKFRIIYRGSRPKPWRLGKELKEMGISAERAIVIGDNPFTDGLGAFLAGVSFYWVLKP